VIPTIQANGTTIKSFRKYLSNIPKSTSRSYRKKPHCAQHTFFGKY